jgi:hypothetical protein
VRILLALALLALAGCGSPSTTPTPTPSLAPAIPVDQDYDLTVRVSQETADGAAMPGVEVQAFVLDDAGSPGPAIPRSTDTQGFARFTFEDPIRIAVRATSPGWTREGVVLQVGETVAFEQVATAAGIHTATVSERDLFLPLFHNELRLSAATVVMTGLVEPAPDGTIHSPVATAALAFPEGLGPAYLARLAAADVRLHWEDTATSRAHLSAGLAWDGEPWVRGEAPSPGIGLGPREASYSGPLPTEGRPADVSAAVLEAAAVLESAAVGDVPLTFDVRLVLAGFQPPGLPVACHSTKVCADPLPPLPPLGAS